MKRLFLAMVLAAMVIVLAGPASAVLSAPHLSVAVTGINVTLSWTPIEGATHYTLVFTDRHDPSGTWHAANLGNIKYLSADLWPGFAFDLAIHAGVGASHGGPSNIETVIIPDVATPVTIPHLRFSVSDVVAVNEVEVTLTWTPVPNATQYALVFKDRNNPASVWLPGFSGLDGVWHSGVLVGATTKTIYLWSGASFDVAVHAGDAAGFGEPSNIETIIISPQIAALEPLLGRWILASFI